MCLLQDCVRRMLTRDPSARATATDVLNHEWVKEDGVAGDVEIEPEVRSCHACAMRQLARASAQPLRLSKLASAVPLTTVVPPAQQCR